MAGVAGEGAAVRAYSAARLFIPNKGIQPVQLESDVGLQGKDALHKGGKDALYKGAGDGAPKTRYCRWR